ncbi:MAG: type II toxin-antitoxin system HicA family toxin [Candidatus Wildermuthbacteria bacterium]|nr:type II toxin-antitoxin system HicA family toxin [Candidatus Wildermuthbacteria bacterium]
MAKTFRGRFVAKILVKEFGFEQVGQKGSHLKLKKKTSEGNIVTIVPIHRELAWGTLRGVLQLAQVDYEEFLRRAK